MVPGNVTGIGTDYWNSGIVTTLFSIVIVHTQQHNVFILHYSKNKYIEIKIDLFDLTLFSK